MRAATLCGLAPPVEIPMHHRLRRPAALFLGLPAAALGALAQAQQPADGLVLEEVTVSAQRRDENIQTVPVSVTAIDPTDIERRQIVDTKQIVFNVPNLTGNSNVGQSTATTFFMRGVGTTENLATADTSVGLYIDDVYIARQGVNNFNLADIERIEVLRGPQGTLYGRNTNGGAIKIVTKKPSAEPEFAVRGSYGNYNRWDLKLSGNTPITDKVFVRANFLTQQGDGYIRNTTLGKDVNDLDYMGGRVALRALPSDNLDINFVVDYSQDKTNGNYASDIGGVLRPSSNDLRRAVTSNDSRGDAKTYGATLTMGWQISDAITLNSITGFRTTEQDLNIELSDQPVSIYTLLQLQESDQLSQEFQLSADLTESVRFVGGLYYFDEGSDVFMTDLTRASAVAAQSFFNKDFSVDVESYAAFGQLEWQIGSFTLLAAARYTSEDRALDIVQRSSIPGPLFNYDTAALRARQAAGQNISPDRSFSDTTPKFGVNWQINDDLFAYASYTEGFRSGGWTGRAFNVNQYINFNPENVESIEAGLKTTLAGGSVRWNTSVFSMDYQDLFNTLTIGGVFTVQTADATIEGVESELTWRATEWLDLFANLGYLDTKYQGTRPANLAPDLQRAPQLQMKAGFSIERPLAAGSLLLNADAFYTDEFLVSPANLAFTAPLLPARAATTGDFTLVNASVGYRWNDDKYEVSASCTNCLDEEYFEGGTYIGAYAGVWTGAPRFYRLNFGMRL
jgi:iron complex outermembrane receptor protein